MITIAFRFLAGRYHATPWGRHVNEGAVEWPPSPWRILRALAATWKRTLPEVPQAQAEPVFRVLANEPPEFLLPPASTGHTRHYMPWFRKGPDDRTLVFDTFVAVKRDARLLVRWPNATLDETQRCLLARILRNLNTFGRSESWCEATLEPGGTDVPPGSSAQPAARLDGCSEDMHRVSRPFDGDDLPPNTEIVRLLCPDPESAFADACVVQSVKKTGGRGRTKQPAGAGSSIYDPAWKLCVETLQLHQERWSDPPGSRWVQYVRPRDCFRIAPTPRARTRRPGRPPVQVVRYALDSTVLPPATQTLPVAEAARRALMSIHGRITEHGGVPGRSPILAGKDEHGEPLTGHGHAYYLPTDEDGDGRLDHLTIVARDGLGDDECRAIDRLSRLNTGRKGEERHPLRLLLLGMGRLEDYCPGPLRASRVWVSATPYIATRHPKTRGPTRIDLNSPLARSGFLVQDLRSQLAAVRPELTGVHVEPVWDGHGAFRVAERWRPIQFQRFRRKPGDDGGRRLAGSFRLTFPVEVGGPIALGWSSHFGLGLFVPGPCSPQVPTACR